MNVDRYIPPPDHPLAPYLDSIWCCSARGDYTRETIMPKGIVNILFNLAGPIRIDAGNRVRDGVLRTAPYLAGIQTTPLLSLPEDEVHLFGVSFKIEGCSAFLRVPMTEITDLFFDASVVFEDAGDLIEQLYEAPGFAERCSLSIAWLLRRLEVDEHVEMIRCACRSLSRVPTGATLDRVASALDLSSRHLRRLFLHHLGIGPSRYIRLSRFTQALYLMTTPATLTEIAHAAHYYDQAHFNRDFKEIAGMTPSEYRALSGRVPGHIFSR